MEFKDRPFECPIFCGSVPVMADCGPRRVYQPREQISLRPEPKGLQEELNAEVLGMKGESLRVRALHSFYVTPSERLVRGGDEFEVSRDKVFHVILPG